MEKNKNFNSGNISASDTATEITIKKPLPVKSRFMTNPMINKLNKSRGENPYDTGETILNGNLSNVNASFNGADIQGANIQKATYKGITLKCLYFMGMVFAGIILAMIISTLPSDSITADGLFVNKTYMFMSGIMAICLIVCPFLISFVRKTTIVAGTIFCLSFGFVFSMPGESLSATGSAICLSLIVTLSLVLSLILLYSSGKIRVQKSFVKTMSVILMASVLASLLVMLSYVIPPLRAVAILVMNNPSITIGCSAGMIVIGCMFLISDFESARFAVESNLPKENEWYLAFSIFFSIIWLYLKILSLVLRILALSNRKRK